MSYDPPSFLALRQGALDAYRNVIPGANILSGTEIYGRASLAAMVASMMSYGIKVAEDQIFISSAAGDSLERHARDYGLVARKPATAAVGTAVLQGDDGAIIPAGTVLTAEDGTQFETTEDAEIADAVVTVAVAASQAGTSGNRTYGDALTVESPPSGLSTEAVVGPDGISGGAAQETDEALRARVLARRRAGNAGGTKADYEGWALEVAGVTEAHVLPLRLGLGSVSVAVFTEDDTGRVPAPELMRTVVLDALNAVRPVTAEVDCPEVTEVELDIWIHLLVLEDGYDEDEVVSAVETALTTWIYTLKTGDTAYRSRIGAVVGAVAGVIDYTILIPDENQVSTVDETTVEIFKPGIINVFPPSWSEPP